MTDFASLRKFDPEIFKAVEDEVRRQQFNIELIASENIVSDAVIEAMAGWFTNKYAEGYPGNRFYGGCENADIVETLAIERAKKLFNADHANVQPHSGAQANFAVYYAVLKPGDTILGMDLAHGGHLTHGSPATISGKYYNAVSYGVNRGFLIDYDEVRELALKHRPRLIVAGTSAYSRALDFAVFADIAKEAGAYLMVDMAHFAGIVAAGYHMNPVPYADFVTTTTHKTLRGPRGGMVLCKKEHADKLDKAVFPGIQGGPLMHIIAAKAVCLNEALQDSYKVYIKNVLDNAVAMADELARLGFNIVSGKTENHLMLIDLRNKNLTGKEMAERLEKVRITCNKNAIPFDDQKTTITSGIRLGTPAVTTRGMNKEDMREIAGLVHIAATDYAGNVDAIKERVGALTARYPIG